MLTITEVDGVRTVAYYDITLGEIIAVDDGEYVLFPAQRTGFWRAWILREIVRELDRLNLEKEMKR